MPVKTNEILTYLNTADVGQINLMEVCGTHTHAIAKAGIKQMLPDNIKLLSGPGCPVCVTPEEEIDAFLDLAMNPHVIITTYGDMIRVPGSTPGDNLALRRAKGADVRVVYSPVDAIEIAKDNMDKEIVFLGVGFETTAPGTAAAIKIASEQGVQNFSIFSMLKLATPALKALIADPLFNVQGFIIPGHVAVIIGEAGFKFLATDYKIPSVVTGFEPEDIWLSLYKLVKQIEAGEPKLENAYTRLVNPSGNKLAMKMIDDTLEVRDDIWRGLGLIPSSGLGIKKEFKQYDAEVKFGLSFAPSNKVTACSCGDIIKGLKEPRTCPLFGTACTPDDPVGPCMVSGEGACSAAYKYNI